uniref:Uncharacterized protein n=1 Tax=Knipowitschia caucasica TaxID=637954 RepID=A0AAV2JEQ1_KNICA
MGPTSVHEGRCGLDLRPTGIQGDFRSFNLIKQTGKAQIIQDTVIDTHRRRNRKDFFSRVNITVTSHRSERCPLTGQNAAL